MIHKIIVGTLVGIEVLTMFPLIFFGIYFIVNSVNVRDMSTASLMGPLIAGIIYIVSVLFGAYMAFQKIQTKPLLSYVFAVIPLIIIATIYFMLNP